MPRASRPPGYYTVAGIDLEREAERLRGLAVFAGGPLRKRAALIRVRRARRRPHRLGFAVPAEWRISVTSYPGIRPGDVQETLLHELVHLHAGSEPGHRRWHGPAFRDTLRRAMREAYGVEDVDPSNALHGAYADALEALRARPPRGDLSGQLELPLAS